MTTANIEWRATNLVALGEELQERVNKVRHQFQQRANTARSNDEADRLRQRLGQLVDSIQESYREQVALLTEGESNSDNSLYDRNLAGIDMDLLVYRGDKKSLAELLADSDFSSNVNRLLAEMKPFNARKELLTKALKISRGMMPSLYKVSDSCASSLDLNAEIEIYVNQDSRFNAACYPPAKDKVLLVVTSALLESFDETELAFVIGHEIGHYLFEHTRFPVDYILQNHDGRLSPLHAMKMYAWIRNAEITADRVGLVCCRDFQVAAKTFFKLSSGITTSSYQFSVADYLRQLDELRGELEQTDNDPQDWFSTHPFNPLRLKALEIFSRGKPYYDLVGAPGEGLSREQVAEEVFELMTIMEPTYLQDTSDVGKKAQRYLLTAGYLVAAANGVVEESEVRALASILGHHVSPQEIQAMLGRQPAEVSEEVTALAEELVAMLPGVKKLQLIRDMVVISYADGVVDQQELDCLVWLCQGLGVDPQFIEQVLRAAQSGVD